MDKQAELAAKNQEMQHLFVSLTSDQRTLVINYLNSYNLTAWLYNELLDDKCREYIDQAMKYTMETAALSKELEKVSGDPAEVDQVVSDINFAEDGEED